jgi:hypothetical protein
MDVESKDYQDGIKYFFRSPMVNGNTFMDNSRNKLSGEAVGKSRILSSPGPVGPTPLKENG